MYEIKASESEEWDIFSKVKGEKVAEIRKRRSFTTFARGGKMLYVNDYAVCEIRNQKEALVKLSEFFEKNKLDIEIIESDIADVIKDSNCVTHKQSKTALVVVIKDLNAKLDILKSRNLT